MTETKDDDIEVTSAMIAAGVSELVRFNPDYDQEKDAVVRIFLAMIEAADPANRPLSDFQN